MSVWLQLQKSDFFKRLFLIKNIFYFTLNYVYIGEHVCESAGALRGLSHTCLGLEFQTAERFPDTGARLNSGPQQTQHELG